MPRKPAAKYGESRRPPQWDKMVAAAYLRMIGSTQEEAATAVGRCERSIREWESRADLWEKARAEARSRWLNDVEDAARGAVMGALGKGDGDLGLKVLERLDDKFAPPKQRQEVTGAEGGPVEVNVTHRVIDPSADH